MDEQHSFLAGYLFLQSIYYGLKMKNVFRTIASHSRFDFDIDAICSDLVYARILDPGSKLSSYKTASTFLEQPKYELHDVYRALGTLSKEMDHILAEVYKNSNHILKRNNSVLYYDCTNYYFEIEDGPEGSKGFGLHRTYASDPDRPIDLCVEIRDGDVALVPHGYHGPCVAAPGYDMYYLNVMAGPDEDLVWLAPDDPAHHWIRDTWEGQDVDPRLPMTC